MTLVTFLNSFFLIKVDNTPLLARRFVQTAALGVKGITVLLLYTLILLAHNLNTYVYFELNY